MPTIRRPPALTYTSRRSASLIETQSDVASSTAP